MTAERTLLIDADVFAYIAASANEVETHWGEGYWTWHAWEEPVKAHFDRLVEEAMDTYEATSCRLCLTDTERNWRFDVLPTYKGNRSNVKKPLLLKHIKEWIVEERDGLTRPRLEGDDIMGIFATWKAIKGEKIIVSIDKDMKTIPGLYVRNVGDDPVYVSEEEADKWHLKQTLSGDQTDGYAGCPGIGAERAAKVIDEGLMAVPYEHTLLRGPRKGQVEIRYDEASTEDLWAVVVSKYEAAGLTEEDALVQARVARILRASDYNFKKKEPILWQPKKVR